MLVRKYAAGAPWPGDLHAARSVPGARLTRHRRWEENEECVMYICYAEIRTRSVLQIHVDW